MDAKNVRTNPRVKNAVTTFILTPRASVQVRIDMNLDVQKFNFN